MHLVSTSFQLKADPKRIPPRPPSDKTTIQPRVGFRASAKASVESWGDGSSIWRHPVLGVPVFWGNLAWLRKNPEKETNHQRHHAWVGHVLVWTRLGLLVYRLFNCCLSANSHGTQKGSSFLRVPGIFVALKGNQQENHNFAGSLLKNTHKTHKVLGVVNMVTQALGQIGSFDSIQKRGPNGRIAPARIEV